MDNFFNSLAQHPPFFIGAVFVVGLMVGSFLNVVIHRLPIMLEAAFRQDCLLMDQPPGTVPPPLPKYNLVVPRSACPQCKTMISAWDNIPVISWGMLKGRCRHCRNPISIRYPAVEMVTALLSAAIAHHYGFGTQALAALVFCWALIALFWIDLDTYYLPDSLTLGLLWAGLLANSFGLFVPLSEAVVGAMAGYLSLWLVYWGFKLLTGKEGMGYGDFKLLAALGAWMGWKALPVIILLSSLVGALLGVGLVLLARRGWAKPLPFGPYLALAGLLALFQGDRIRNMIWGF